MRSLAENLSLFFIGIISGTFGIAVSEIHPILPTKSEMIMSLLFWFVFLTLFIIYKVKRYVILALPVFTIVFLANYYYIGYISLIFTPVIPLLPLILILPIYLAKRYNYKNFEFVLRAIAISFLGICIVFIFWMSMFL